MLHTHAQQGATLRHTTPIIDKDSCPRCGSLVWEQTRRTALQKLLKPNHGRCHCRACQREFWLKLD